MLREVIIAGRSVLDRLTSVDPDNRPYMMVDEYRRDDVFEYAEACALRSRMTLRHGSASVERINGEWRAVFDAPTRIPQHPKQEQHNA